MVTPGSPKIFRENLDAEAIKEELKLNHDLERFVQEGTKLLEETERPNIITLAQFEPFIELFRMDKQRYDTDRAYEVKMRLMWQRYVRECSINLYQPTIVVRSETDPTECYFLNRLLTRLSGALPDGNSAKENVPANVPKTGGVEREDLLANAALHDLAKANATEAQRAYFRSVRVDSALIMKHFVERNLRPEKRAEFTGEKISDPDAVPGEIGDTIEFDLDDGE